MKNKVKSMGLVFVAIMLLCPIIVMAVSAITYVAHKVDFKIYFNGEEQELDNAVVTIGDRTYIQVREFCDITGLNLAWDEETGSVLMSDGKHITMSKEGTLQNGREYIFYGEDRSDLSVPEYIEKLALFEEYELDSLDYSVEVLAEKAQNLLPLKNLSVERARIMAYYDKNSGLYMFKADYYGSPWPGGHTAIVIDVNENKIKVYRSRGV